MCEDPLFPPKEQTKQKQLSTTSKPECLEHIDGLRASRELKLNFDGNEVKEAKEM